MSKFIDLTGKKFGLWRVVEYSGNSLWKCLCDCGTERIVKGFLLRGGRSNSCGCLRSDLISFRNTTHGKTKTSEYNIWRKMICRCTLVNDPNYKNYGARGIKVCDRWRDFTNFLEDVGLRPSDSHSLEREDNNKGYSPDNCRWATKIVQANNRRTNRLITAFGETKTITEWTRDKSCFVGTQTINFRISKLGWEPEIAISTPSTRNKKLGVKGVYITSYGKYSSYINVNKTKINLGNFKTLEEAKKARKDAELKYWGKSS